jgi:hypothetical protein
LALTDNLFLSRLNRGGEEVETEVTQGRKYLALHMDIRLTEQQKRRVRETAMSQIPAFTL